MHRQMFNLTTLLALFTISAVLTAGVYHQEEALLSPADIGPGDHFGWSVDVSGNLAIVGAPTTLSVGTPGRAYIYHFSEGAWTLEATLTSGYPNSYDLFGHSVSIAGDLAVVGNPLDEEWYPGEGLTPGAIHVYRRSAGGAWTEEAKLFGNDGPWKFGWSVDTDGQKIIAGERNPISIHTSAIIFGLVGDQWQSLATFTHTNDIYWSQGTYSNSVAIDGAWSAVGDPDRDPDVYYGSQDGVVYRFDNMTAHETVVGGEPDDEFGYAVAVDDNRFAAGAPGKDMGGFNRGSVKVGLDWVTPTDSHDQQRFGVDVALLGDLLAATSGERALHLFEQDPGTLAWNEAFVIADVGTSVALDGERMIAGDPATNGDTGIARIFRCYRSCVGAAISATPDSGATPFISNFRTAMTNRNIDHHRRFAFQIDVTIGNGQSFSTWRRGYDNFAPSLERMTTWNQAIPDLPTLVGDNTFVLKVEDVTPSPYNQPPHPAAGDTASATMVLTVIE